MSCKESRVMEKGMRQTGCMPEQTAVLLVASRTAVDSQDFDLREGTLIRALMWPVRHDHYQDSDKRDKGIADQN